MEDGAEKFAANAELAIETLSGPAGFSLGYDEKSLEWVDGYIERQRAGGDANLQRALIGVLGSYFGECLRRTYGGRWTLLDGNWAIELKPGNAVFPFSKTSKQFESGHEGGDSIHSLFRSIPVVFKNLGGTPSA